MKADVKDLPALEDDTSPPPAKKLCGRPSKNRRKSGTPRAANISNSSPKERSKMNQ